MTPPGSLPTARDPKQRSLFRSRVRAAGADAARKPGRGRRLPEGTLYVLPNLFTAASLFLALFALVKAAEGDFVMASWLILGSAICDAIDGPVARLTHTSSSFGLQFDSLADVVAFGVAPAFLMFQNLKGLDVDGTVLPGYAPRLALGACALFAICSAVRLARFNVQAGTVENRFFQGLPTPGAAGTVVAAYLFVEWLTKMPFIAQMETTRILHRSILILMFLLSVFMVSEIPFPKLRSMLSFSRKPFNNLVAFVFIACVLLVFQDAFPLFLFGGFAVYLAVSVAFARRHRREMALEESPDPFVTNQP